MIAKDAGSGLFCRVENSIELDGFRPSHFCLLSLDNARHRCLKGGRRNFKRAAAGKGAIGDRLKERKRMCIKPGSMPGQAMLTSR